MTQVFSPTSTPPRTDTPPSSSPTRVNVTASPSLSDNELVNRVRLLFSKSRALRKPTVQQWVRNYRIMRNRTWSSGRPNFFPGIEVPECRSIIGACVAWLTDQRPQFDLVPAAQPFSPYADFFSDLSTDMKTAMNAAWQTYLYESQVEVAAWDAYQFGLGIFKTFWNPALADGLGDADFRRIDPFSLYPDPASTSPLDANYFIEARTISLQELDRRFPGAAKRYDIHGYRESTDEMPNLRLGTGMAPRANPGAVAPATSAQWGLEGQAREHVRNDDSGITLLECWLREHTVTEGKDAAGNPSTKVYDTWRCVCVAGPYVLLNKRADEILPFSTHPYDFFAPESMGEFYNQSMVELLTPSQVSINELLASMQHNISLTGNPVWKESSRSGLQRTTMHNKPGQRVTVAAGDTESGWVMPPGLNPAMMELIQFHVGAMERNSGLSAIQQGVVPGGRVAGDVYDSAMEAGFVRIRLAQRNLEYALRRVGQKLASLIGEFYTEPRFLAIVGPDGARTTRVLRARHFYLPTEEGAVPLRFQVQVRAGSMLPTSRNARIAEMDTLYAMGAIDRPVLLEAHDVPNRQAIVERMAEMDAKGLSQAPGARQRAQRTH